MTSGKWMQTIVLTDVTAPASLPLVVNLAHLAAWGPLLGSEEARIRLDGEWIMVRESADEISLKVVRALLPQG